MRKCVASARESVFAGGEKIFYHRKTKIERQSFFFAIVDGSFSRSNSETYTQAYKN